MKCDCGDKDCKAEVNLYEVGQTVSIFATGPRGSHFVAARLSPANAILLANELIQKANSILDKAS
jgi:hypothetical protein